jgi:transposase InsO family protein
MVGGGEVRQAARAILESVFGIPTHEFKTLMYKGASGGMQGTRKSVSRCEGLKEARDPAGIASRDWTSAQARSARRRDALEKLERWRRDYNEVRPHGVIGSKPPIALINCGQASSPASERREADHGKRTLT